jgi:hypothetical protein
MTSARMSSLAVIALCAPLSGCVGYTGASSGNTCRYGLRTGQSGSTCYSRPKPSSATTAAAMTGQPLVRALAAWRAAGGVTSVGSVGINQWGETTFTVSTGAKGFGAARERLASFDVNGRPTSGDAGYSTDPGAGDSDSDSRDPVPLSAVDADTLARLITTLRAGHPETHMLQAVINLDRDSGDLAWHIEMISSKAQSSLVYYAEADGSNLCHASDDVPGDQLVPAPGVPECSFTPVIFGFDFAIPSRDPTGITVARPGAPATPSRQSAPPAGTAPRTSVTHTSTTYTYTTHVSGTLRESQRLLRCVKRAGTDVQKLARCAPH